MTVTELINKLQELPGDARVEVGMPVKVNANESFITRQVDKIDYDERTNICSLSSFWRIQFFY